MTSSIACILGAGYSFVAGLPLAKDLFTPFWGLAKSEASLKRLAAVREHYDDWQLRHPQDYPEQYMGQIFSGALKDGAPKWEWVVEYVSASIASAGTPGGSHNTNPRYSNRVNRPLLLDTYRSFWRTLTDVSCDISVLTT